MADPENLGPDKTIKTDAAPEEIPLEDPDPWFKSPNYLRSYNLDLSELDLGPEDPVPIWTAVCYMAGLKNVSGFIWEGCSIRSFGDPIADEIARRLLSSVKKNTAANTLELGRYSVPNPWSVQGATPYAAFPKEAFYEWFKANNQGSPLPDWFNDLYEASPSDMAKYDRSGWTAWPDRREAPEVRKTPEAPIKEVFPGTGVTVQDLREISARAPQLIPVLKAAAEVNRLQKENPETVDREQAFNARLKAALADRKKNGGLDFSDLLFHYLYRLLFPLPKKGRPSQK